MHRGKYRADRYTDPYPQDELDRATSLKTPTLWCHACGTKTRIKQNEPGDPWYFANHRIRWTPKSEMERASSLCDGSGKFVEIAPESPLANVCGEKLMCGGRCTFPRGHESAENALDRLHGVRGW